MVKLLICIVGMPGSGKSLVAEVARELGLPVYNMGDVVREETLKRYGRIMPDLMVEVSKILRNEYGEEVVALRTIERIDSSKEVIVVDGVRSLREVSVFKNYAREVVVVAVHASPKTRFNRIRSRRRPGDPDKWSEFVKRDHIELSFGIGDVIALADYMIVNEGSVEDTREYAKELFRRLVESVCKS